MDIDTQKTHRLTLHPYLNTAVRTAQSRLHRGGGNGTPTVLIADSRNDRVVEYAREDGEWTRAWVLRGGGLDEPRDADRLPNGNTLVVDRRGDRLLEVTPTGEVVWEFYAPWQPYDAERIGTYEMTGSAGVSERRTEACYEYLTDWSGSDRLLPDDPTTSSGGVETQSDGRLSGESALGEAPARLPDTPLLVAGGVGLILVTGFVLLRYRD
ncbi:MAG: hypothetical protein ACI80F_001680 [Natronomonas sp.]